jgi:hypothetical protein
MGETNLHKSYIRNLVEWVQYHKRAKNMYIYAEGFGLSGNNPQKIYDSIPDLFAITEDKTFVVIGEAKTESDIEREHTYKQIQNYLKYINQIGDGILVLAVPWHLCGLMDGIVRNIKCSCNYSNIPHEIIRYLPAEI